MSYFDHNEEAVETLKTFPRSISEGMVYYIDKGTPMGSFLTALFSNDLFKCYMRADKENQRLIGNYIHFIHWHCPQECYGSIEIVNAWIKSKEVIELKPCPFCGDKQVYQQDFHHGYSIACGCGASGPPACDDDDGGEEVAANLWNKRIVK